MHLQRKTEKLYYRDFHLARAATRIARVGTDHLELEATVAFPEGGGQEADFGTIEVEGGRRLGFNWVRRMYAAPCPVPGLGHVQAGGVIWHMVDVADLPLLAGLLPGMPAVVHIDIERRAALATSHTASHLLYLSIGLHRPDAMEATIGCHIKVNAARFDFAVERRFEPQELEAIQATANGFVARDATVAVSAHPQAPDARLWHCEGHTIPCGGIHIERVCAIGPLQLHRRRLGAGKERIACTFPRAALPLASYHDGSCQPSLPATTWTASASHPPAP